MDFSRPEITIISLIGEKFLGESDFFVLVQKWPLPRPIQAAISILQSLRGDFDPKMWKLSLGLYLPKIPRRNDARDSETRLEQNNDRSVAYDLTIFRSLLRLNLPEALPYYLRKDFKSFKLRDFWRCPDRAKYLSIYSMPELVSATGVIPDGYFRADYEKLLLRILTVPGIFLLMKTRPERLVKGTLIFHEEFSPQTEVEKGTLKRLEMFREKIQRESNRDDRTTDGGV